MKNYSKKTSKRKKNKKMPRGYRHLLNEAGRLRVRELEVTKAGGW